MTLFEAGPRLGGQVLLAARAGWRRDMVGIADWLASELETLGVAVHANRLAASEDVAALAPDLVIVATGGVPDTALPEGGGELALDAWSVLGGQASVAGEVLVCDEVGGHAAISLADRLAAEGHDVTLATPDREPGRALGGQNYPVYLRNLYRAGARFLCDHALVGLARDGNRLVARLRNAYSRDVVERMADTVVVDRGTLPVTDVFDALIERSRNLGEVDHEALVALAPQPADANPRGDFLLFRVGDAVAGRDIHAAMLDSNRLCRVL